MFIRGQGMLAMYPVPVLPQEGHFAHNSLRFPHIEDYREISPLSALAALR